MEMINLFEYQKKYYEEIQNHLKSKTGCILAMDTGMGKTYVATRLIQDCINEFPSIKILVLVRKKNLEDPWGDLFKTTLVTEDGKPCYFSYTKENASKFKSNKDAIVDLTDFNVVLANYEVMEPNISDFRFTDWDLVIYDEFHDRDSKVKVQIVLKQLSNLHVKKQLALTASPLKNTMKELLVLHEFVKDNTNISNVYRNIKTFENKFISNKMAQIDHDGFRGNKREYAIFSFEKFLADKLKPFIGNGIFYHSKRDKEVPVLPPLINRNIFLPLHYNQSTYDFLDLLRDNDPILWSNDAVIMETAPAAAQCYGKIAFSEPDLGISTKEVFTIQLIQHIVDSTEDKIVVFSQFTSILSYFLRKLSKFGCIYIDGKTKDYMKQIENFRNNPAKRVILVSLEAFKEGIDLRCANHVVFLDLPYNPQVLIQAKDRCHRTGQQKNVFAYYLFYMFEVPELKNSPDNIRRKILKKKTMLFDYLFGVDKEGNRLPEYIVEDYIIQYPNGDVHLKDIFNHYSELKSFLTLFLKKEDVTHQFKEYDSSKPYLKSSFTDSNIRVDYSRLEGINPKPTEEAETTKNLPLLMYFLSR